MQNKFDTLKDVSINDTTTSSGVAVRSQATTLSTLKEGCTLRGAFECQGNLELEGFIEGDVVAHGSLVIGETAVARANIRAGSLVVFGQLTGDIICDGLVELQGGAQVKGNIKARRIVIQDGVVFDGHCKMSPDKTSGIGTTTGALDVEQSPEQNKE